MFSLIRIIIWITGVVTVSAILLGIFGYGIDWSYFGEQKARCNQMTADCRNTIIHKGVDGAVDGCRFDCIDIRPLIRKH